MGKEIRILLADDHTIVRQGLEKLLAEQPDFKVVGEAINGQVVIEKAETLRPHVIILDIAMPMLNGIEAAKRIRKILPSCKILILSMYSHEHYIHQLLEVGISGYLLKDSNGQDIIKAIHAAMNNETFLSPSISKKVIESYLSPRRISPIEKRYEKLSDREREIFQLLAEGQTARQITQILCISISTVKTHRAKIMEKLGVDTPIHLAQLAIKLGLVDPEF